MRKITSCTEIRQRILYLAHSLLWPGSSEIEWMDHGVEAKGFCVLKPASPTKSSLQQHSLGIRDEHPSEKFPLAIQR